MANNLGNLLQRTSTLIVQNFDGKIPDPPSAIHPLQITAQETCNQVKNSIINFSLNSALFKIIDLLNVTNQFLEKEEPWKKIKTHPHQAGSVLYIALEIIRVSAHLLAPILPEASFKILKRIGISMQTFEQTKQTNQLKAGQLIIKESAIFPRIEKIN